jgi:hypothetical protein
MTFTEFQSLCNQVVTTTTAAAQPCPIVIGDVGASTIGGYGVMVDGKQKQLVALKEAVPTAPMLQILSSCRFTYDAANNQTVIEPATTGT